MKTDGQAFLEYIADAATNKFEARFSMISTRLDLGAALDAKELSLLYEAAFMAALCHISFNCLVACHGEKRPQREMIRTLLEREFMAARSRFFHCAGSCLLSSSQRSSINSIFLNVFVADENLD